MNEGFTERVLLVDDDRELLALELAILASEGLDITTVLDGTSALQQLRGSNYDLVVTDLTMPGLHGLELLNGVLDADPDAVVIVCSSHSRVDIAVECLRAGAFDFVPKPFTPALLTAAVRRGIQHRRLRLATSLYRASQAMLEATDPEALIAAMLVDAMRVLQGSTAVLLARAEADGPHGVQHTAGLPLDSGIRDALVSLTAQVDRDRDPMRLAGSDGRPHAAAFPLTAGQRQLGVLWVLRSHRRRPYDGRDLERGAVFAAQAALGLDNRLLVDELGARIASLQETRRRLYTSARLEGVGRMATEVARNLRNPLDYLSTNLREVARHFTAGDVSRTDAMRRLTSVEQGLERVRQLVDDLAKIAQIREKSRYELGQAVRLAVRLCAEPPTDVQIEGDAVVQGNPGQFAQALVALIVNAQQAVEGRPNPNVTVRVSTERMEALVEVIDNGDGIPEEALPLIAEPFYSRRGRDGLGLHTVREVTEYHGGRMKVASAENIGTTVSLFLPCDPIDDMELAVDDA
jgi:two-component system phosphate regulon sensor histidine kinase PhoR